MLSRILCLLSSVLFLSGNPDELTPKKAPAPVKVSNQTLRMMFAGDIMSQLVQIESAKVSDNEYNYDACFSYMRPIFKQADLVIGNLECTLSDVPPYTGFPNFISPDQLVSALKKNGFDVLVTANNHALDGGLQGLSRA